MIIVMKRHAPEETIQRVIDEIEKAGMQPVPLIGTERTVIAIIGDERGLDEAHFRSLPHVSTVMPVLRPYKLASRETKHESTIIRVGNVEIGGQTIAMMAGPCSVENEDQIEESTRGVKALGANILRGGAFKPRTGPYAFQGLGREGIDLLSAAGKRHDMVTVSEIMDVRDVEFTASKIDILQIGARNMQNFDLLKEVGRLQNPILLKRGMSATIKEFLLAAEYILAQGNPNVILCERGIRTFEDETRNTLCIATVPIVKELSHLPIIVDPSHGTGKVQLIPPMAKAAIAAGADGIMVEVHPNPDVALSDADQALDLERFGALMNELGPITHAVNRTLPND
ncbi:3-deoxy-7-phosphoheptulonate synthase [Candidatus Peregrinibacteria bacterium CG_4_9_14_0_2_um_filter_53_11]|nr:MAG: 3-deoxy-7-phosphoheptulonate synthase [Candidatus Peregrinibacteria bacterium CG_4_9_14_0_2_um_filter_53_11]